MGGNKRFTDWTVVCDARFSPRNCFHEIDEARPNKPQGPNERFGEFPLLVAGDVASRWPLIIMRRYELRSTIMTSDRPIEEWGKLIGDVPTATVILDRFLDRATVIRITHKSYRPEDKAYAPIGGHGKEKS